METAVPNDLTIPANELTITADWERLDQGSPEERACFSAISIYWGNLSLTEGSDGYVKRFRAAPLLSGYHLAEWLAWNWWRLRWEPGRRSSENWSFAHHLTTIGGGYVWPNITIFSDGERTAVISKSTPERPNIPFRYISDSAAVLPSRHFESAIDQFIEQIRGQLREEHILDTNLDRIWNDVRAERSDPDAALYRKIEALLSQEPGEGDETAIDQLIEDGRAVGGPAMSEIAADHVQGAELLTAATLRQIAADVGFDATPSSVVQLQPGAGLPRAAEVPAWRLGAAAARSLREQQRLGDGKIDNAGLAELAGVQVKVLADRTTGQQISFALDKDPTHGRVVFRSKWEAGRRFELARLLGERIVNPRGGKLFPATRAHTYRQKMQRSFAAELLAPFEAADEMLAGDYSPENQQDVADYFNVSPMTIWTMLVNHRRIPREELDAEFDLATA
jgi:Zn-dependent peptidase ImmA (M78 family)